MRSWANVVYLFSPYLIIRRSMIIADESYCGELISQRNDQLYKLLKWLDLSKEPVRAL